MKRLLLLVLLASGVGCGKSQPEPELTEDQHQKNVDESNMLQQKAIEGKPIPAG